MVGKWVAFDADANVTVDCVFVCLIDCLITIGEAEKKGRGRGNNVKGTRQRCPVMLYAIVCVN